VKGSLPRVSADPAAVVPPEKSFGGTVGIDLLDLGPERARARVQVSEGLMQPGGIVHGGVYAALAETVCSAATYEAVKADGSVAIGQSNDTSFLRPISRGAVHADARRRHRGRTTWVWEVDMTDDDGRLCALSRMTVAIRPLPGR
jgi:1,4-dihydroxy-2-naphthoyl-CoA hydrolase